MDEIQEKKEVVGRDEKVHAHHGRDFFRHQNFKWVVASLLAVIVLLLAFQAGVFVGIYKAGFSKDWGENYERMFGGPKGMFGVFEGPEMMNGFGISGSIAKIQGNTIIIKGLDGKETTINISSDTVINKGATKITTSDLKVDDQVVIIGNPTGDGTVNAEIIRVFDPNQMPMGGGNTMFFRFHE